MSQLSAKQLAVIGVFGLVGWAPPKNQRGLLRRRKTSRLVPHRRVDHGDSAERHSLSLCAGVRGAPAGRGIDLVGV